MELLGTVLYDQSFENVFSTVLLNSQTIFEFPATFNSTNTDTYEASGNFLDPENTILGTTNYTVDAYGTLITNSYTYLNTIRFKRRELSLDTFFVGGPKVEISIYSESRNTAYEWVQIQNGESFTVWTISYDTSSTSGAFGEPQDTYSVSTIHTYGDINVGNSSLNKASFFGVFPNPVNDKLILCLSENAHVSLFDLSGRIVHSQFFSLNGGAMPVMDVSLLPAGTYLVKAEGHDYVATSKIVVIH